MLKFAYEGTYREDTPLECVHLLNSLNSLPGLKTTCYRFDDKLYSVFFECNNDVSLRFLGRCIDRRYWTYGNNWSITLSNSDVNYNSSVFELYSCSYNEESVRTEALSLVDNMVWVS